MQQIISKFNVIKIQLQRGLDQMYRNLTGRPALRRSKITPDLFLGGQYNIRGIETLKKWGITSIVNMRTSSPFEEEFRKSNLNYLHLPTPDMTAPSIDQLKKGVDFIKNEIERDGKVYIHCKFGEGRGPTMIIAYLMSTGLTFEDAVNQVKKVRTFIKPTRPQVERLREFESLLRVEKSNSD